MFENKKILILGMARSGYAVAKILAKKNEVLVTDMKEQDKKHVKELQKLNVEVVITENPESLLDDSYDMVVKNPGIKPTHSLVLKAEELKIMVTNEVEVAYSFLKKNTIIAVTGSNGKTTTTTIIYEFLKKAREKCILGGNIGIPVSDLVKKAKNKILVLEISCQQLNDIITFKPNIGVLTNLSEVHIDHFGTYEKYKEVKVRLFKNQTSNDLAIINKENKDSIEATKNIASTKLYFSSERQADCCLKDGAIYYKDEKIIEIKEIKIKGTHNLENIMCAIAVVKQFAVSNEVIKKVLKKFNGVEHRIEFVKELNDRKFYNDSKATNVKSTIVALKAFQTPVLLILGGLDRKLPFDELKDYVKHVKCIFCYGETKMKIAAFAKQVNVKCIVLNNLEEATLKAYEASEKDDTILLSPACASWDQFKDMEERGRKFKEYVRRLK